MRTFFSFAGNPLVAAAMERAPHQAASEFRFGLIPGLAVLALVVLATVVGVALLWGAAPDEKSDDGDVR